MVSISCYAISKDDIQNTASVENIIKDFYCEEFSHQDIINTVSSDLQLLQAVHLDSLVTLYSISSEGKALYEIKISDRITDYVSITKDRDGNILLSVDEGSIHNDVVYTPDGTIYVDGNLITYNVEKETASTANDPTIVPKAGAITKYSVYNWKFDKNGNVIIPSGFSQKDSGTGTVNLSGNLASIAISVLISCIVNGLLGGVRGLVSGVASSVVSAVLSEALSMNTSQMNALREAYPDAKKLNFKYYAYGKNGNDSLYSEFLYLFKIYGPDDKTFDGSFVYAGARKVIQST